jgi:chromosome segregation ATPase
MEKNIEQHKQEAMSNMDRRLEAIKEIIVGNNFEKIEAKIGRVAQNLEQTNTRVLGVVEQLSKELNLIKDRLEAKVDANEKRSFEDDEQLRNDVYELNAALEALDETRKQDVRDLELNHQMLEGDLNKKNEEQDEALDAQQRRLQKLEQAVAEQGEQIGDLEKNVKRIDSLEETLAAIRQDFSAGLAALTEEVKALKRADEQLYSSISEEVEDRRNDMEQLEGRVQEAQADMKAYLSERSRVFVARQEKLEDRMEGLDDRLIGLHDLIEDDVFKYFEDLKQHKKENRKRLQAIQQEIYNQMDDGFIRLEGRVDGLMESNTKAIKKLSKKLKQKESIKRTLGRLGDLLDD